MTLGEANAPGDASEVLPAAGESRVARWRERAGLVALCLVVGWFYFWTVRSSGDPWKFGREQKDYYNLLLDGWLDGHLHMKVAVPEALQRLDDPYDPKRRPPELALHDASFYHGKYYLYFGAAPVVVLLLPFRLITGIDLPLAAAVLVFVYGGFLASVAALLEIRRRHFPETSAFVTLLGVAVLGFAGLGCVLVRRPHMWELPIGAGYCFAMLTLWCVARSLHARRGRMGWFAAAGLMLALAIASRPTYLLASPLLAVPLIGWWRAERRLPWPTALAGAAPLVVIGLALAWHNYARFGNPLQFGQAYQLSLDYESKVTHFSPRYVGFNTWRYFFSAAQWSRYFPFIHPAELPPKPPGFAGHDDVYGVLRNMPIAWLALLAPLGLWRRPPAERGVLGAWLASTSVLFAAMAGVLLAFFGSLARYESDFTPALMLLACVGVFALERVTRVGAPAFARWITRPLTVALALYSIVFAVLFSLQLDGLLGERNPEKARRVAEGLNRIPAAVERLLGVKHGAVTLTLQLRPDTSGERVLLTVGDAPHVVRVFVRYGEEGRVQFGYAQDDAPAVLSRPLEWDFGRPHEVRVKLGALLPPRSHPMFSGWDAAEVSQRTREVAVELDGESIIDERRRFDGNTGQLRVGGAVDGAAATKMDGEILAVSRSALEPATTSGSSGAGFVRLRLEFPDRANTPREPLVAFGAPTDDGLVFVHYFDDAGRIAFGYAVRGERTLETPAAIVEVKGTHELIVQWTATGVSARRRLWLRLDGRILAARDVEWPSRDGAIVAGQNVNDEAGCAARFGGRLLQVQRSADGRDPLLAAGDTLRLRLQLPRPAVGTREPLVVTGRYAAGDLLLIEYVGDKAVRFGLDHWGSGIVMSEPVSIDFARPHDVEITLPSLAAPVDASLERPVQRGRVTVVVDGGRIWEHTVDLFTAEAEEFWIGRNAIGGTNCGPVFTGEVLSAERQRPN